MCNLQNILIFGIRPLTLVPFIVLGTSAAESYSSVRRQPEIALPPYSPNIGPSLVASAVSVRTHNVVRLGIEVDQYPSRDFSGLPGLF